MQLTLRNEIFLVPYEVKIKDRGFSITAFFRIPKTSRETLKKEKSLLVFGTLKEAVMPKIYFDFIYRAIKFHFSSFTSRHYTVYASINFM